VRLSSALARGVNLAARLDLTRPLSLAGPRARLSDLAPARSGWISMTTPH